MAHQSLWRHGATFVILLQGVLALQSPAGKPLLLGQQITAEHPHQYIPFLQSSEYLKKIGYEEHQHAFKDLYEDLQGTDYDQVRYQQKDADEHCIQDLQMCPWVLNGAMYNLRLSEILRQCQNDIARICPRDLKKRTQRIDKLQQSLMTFGPADVQFDALKESFDAMPEHCLLRSKACQNKEFLAILHQQSHVRRQEMPSLRNAAMKLKRCKQRSQDVVQMAVEATARQALTSFRKAFRGVLEWMRFTDRISKSEFDGAWTSVNQFLNQESFMQYANDELRTSSEPAPPGGLFPERMEKKVSEAKCPENYKHQMYSLGKYVNEKVQAFGANQVLDAAFGACMWLSSNGKCLQLIAAMSAGKRMDQCHMSTDSGAGHDLLERALPLALESMQNMENMDVGATLDGAFRSIHGGRASYRNEDRDRVLASWRSQVEREVPAAVDQHNAIMKALEVAARNAMQAAAEVPCASYINKDL